MNRQEAKKKYFQLRQTINMNRIMGGNYGRIANADIWKEADALEEKFQGLSGEWLEATDAEIDAVVEGKEVKVVERTCRTIFYFGQELEFRVEVKTINEAQALIDYETRQGRTACALHENGKHQVFASSHEERG